MYVNPENRLQIRNNKCIYYQEITLAQQGITVKNRKVKNDQLNIIIFSLGRCGFLFRFFSNFFWNIFWNIFEYFFYLVISN